MSLNDKLDAAKKARELANNVVSKELGGIGLQVGGKFASLLQTVPALSILNSMSGIQNALKMPNCFGGMETTNVIQKINATQQQAESVAKGKVGDAATDEAAIKAAAQAKIEAEYKKQIEEKRKQLLNSLKAVAISAVTNIAMKKVSSVISKIPEIGKVALVGAIIASKKSNKTVDAQTKQKILQHMPINYLK